MSEHLVVFDAGQVMLTLTWLAMFGMVATSVFHRSLMVFLAGALASLGAVFASSYDGMELLRLVPILFAGYFVIRLIKRS